MLPFNRGKAVGIQTPAYSQTVLDEATSMRNQAENAGLLGLSPAADKFFIPHGDEQVHHISGLRMLDPVYAHTNSAQRQELQAMTPSGHALLNFMLMPASIHQGKVKGADSIHNFLRQEGLERSGNIDPNSFIGRAEAVRNGTFEEKKAIMQEYATEILPKIKDKMNDLMNAYYANERLGPQAVEAKAMKDSVMNNIIKQVGRDELREYDNQVRQNGGDDRQVTINADTVILEKAINGNGRRRR